MPLFFPSFLKKIFLKSNFRAYKIFLKSNNLCTKKSVVPTIFLKSRFFLKSGFLKSRAYCIHSIIALNWCYFEKTFEFLHMYCKKPPWLSGKALDKNSLLFCFPQVVQVQIQVKDDLFWPFSISVHQSFA